MTATRRGRFTPAEVVDEALARIAAAGSDAVWIARVPAATLRAAVARLAVLRPDARGPLWGIPFAVKDNIDVAGMTTTAACPAFGYVATESAPVVTRLEAAGAILLGKTNLDQFATGLVGTRSPYGTPCSPFDATMAPGGSSSGSAVAVAAGLVGFALGTDTAGSGRVPAAFNNIVGLKPTRGLVPTRGVVPACRSLDCVSIFANTVADARHVLAVVAGPDPVDPYSRPPPPGFQLFLAAAATFRFGVPHSAQRAFFGDSDAASLYRAAIARAEACGGVAVEVDLAPFTEAAALLYGAWTTERAADLEDWLRERPEALLDVTRGILAAGLAISGTALFRAQHRLATLAGATAPVWNTIDVLLLPTAPTAHSLAAITADPVQRNSELGHYTNFANLLDLAAIAIPAGFVRRDTRPPFPFGVTLVAPAWHDGVLAALAERLHHAAGLPSGATAHPVPPPAILGAGSYPTIDLAVFGAHLSGQPLNPELRALGARLLRPCRTAPSYHMLLLPGTPARPAMRRVAAEGAALPGEIWSVPSGALAELLATIRPPLGLGTVELDDGPCHGFIAEDAPIPGSYDITAHGGWAAWRRAARP